MVVFRERAAVSGAARSKGAQAQQENTVKGTLSNQKRLCPRAICPPNTSPLEISSGIATKVEVVAEELLVKVIQDAVEESR